MMVGAEESGGTKPVVVFEPRRHGQAVGQQFQYDVAMQTGPHRLSILFGMMRNKTDRFFQITSKHGMPPL